jgi:hypothetical protein
VNGVEGLLDEPRPNTPRSIPMLWSGTRSRGRRRSSAGRSIYGLEQSADGGEERVIANRHRAGPVCIWIGTASVEHFRFSKDPEFVEKVRDIGSYPNPVPARKRVTASRWDTP